MPEEPEKPRLPNIPAASQSTDIKINQKTADKRLEYSNGVDAVLELARGKLENRWTKNADKLSWCRVVIQAASSGNDILRDSELEILSERVYQLEEAMKCQKP